MELNDFAEEFRHAVVEANKRRGERIEAATELATSTMRRISEVADACGSIVNGLGIGRVLITPYKGGPNETVSQSLLMNRAWDHAENTVVFTFTPFAAPALSIEGLDQTATALLSPPSPQGGMRPYPLAQSPISVPDNARRRLDEAIAGQLKRFFTGQ